MEKPRTGQKVQSVFTNSVSKDLFSKPPRLQTRTQALPELPAEHLCVKAENGSVKYTLGNSLHCRHLMELLLEKDYTEEQMRDFAFQLLKNIA